jgi:Na+-driven multidrug efflux pump
VLRGAGRTGIAAIITATYVTINLGIVSADLALHGGLMVVPIAAGAAGAVEIALGFGALVHVGLVRPRRLTAWRPDTWRMLLRIGLPVGITSVVLAVVDLVLLRIVGPAGQQAVAGFNVGYTIQAAVIVPAVGLGSAIAVLMNQSLPGHGLAAYRVVFRRGLLLATAGYASVTVALILLGGPLASVMSGNPAVAEQARHFVMIVGPTFGCTGLTLVVLTILEQVGHGRIAVLMNSGYFLVVLVIGALAVHAHHQVTGLYWTMAIAAVIGLVTGMPITVRAGRNPRVLRR